MRRAYTLMLRLYPADFQAMFGVEMRESLELSGKGVTKECFALLIGAVREHAAKCFHSKDYLRNTVDFETSLKSKTTTREMEGLIRRVIGEMEFAIAHHDFPQARVCCEQEERARKRLKQLSASS